MSILSRYILRETLIPFVLGLAVFTSILLVARILKLVELVVNRGVSLLQMLELFSYILPAFLEVTVPMALLLAVLVAFGRLSSDSEVVALQASGVNLYRIARPVALVAAGVAILTLMISLFVRPWGNSRLRTGLFEVVQARASAGLRERVFNDDFHGLVIYVDRIEPPGNRLHGILISDSRDEDEKNTVFSRYGVVVSDERTHTLTLRLHDGSIYSRDRGRGFQDTRFSTYDINLDLDMALAELAQRERDVSELGYGELTQRIERKRAAGEPAYAERVELHRKFSIPFACFIFAALGVPLGTRPTRSVHSWGFSVSLILIFVYYLLLTLGQSLGERGTVPPSVALWWPNLLLSAVAATLFARSARGQSSGRESAFRRKLAERLRRLAKR